MFLRSLTTIVTLTTLALFFQSCKTPATKSASTQSIDSVSDKNPFSLKKCRKSCVTPFGTQLGSARGVVAYSNCQSLCLDPVPAQVHGIFTGVRHQSIEYVRRFLIETKKVTFGSVDSAPQIWDLKEAYNPNKETEKRNFINHPNGGDTPPRLGDLIIYAESANLPAGHVAVVTKVTRRDGRYSVVVAEQNFYNKKWAYPRLGSRAISVQKIGHTYKINAGKDTIIGWKSLD